MRDTEVRIKYIKQIELKPFTLEIDILSEKDLEAYLELFLGWDDRIYGKLLKVKKEYELSKDNK